MSEAELTLPSAGASAADRIPTLDVLLRVEDVRRTLERFLPWGLDGIGLFDRHGGAFMVVSPADEATDSPVAGWESVPPEAAAAQRGGDSRFGIGDNTFEVRPLFAGADRVGVAIYAVGQASAEEAQKLVDPIDSVMASLLQAGFATWVTSELHLAASESTHLALEHQNAELKRAVEHLREIDKLKSNFLATVSHELRTPLTSVIGFADMLLQGIAGDLNEEQGEYVQTILDRGEELLRLITQILEMSRMEMGTVRLSLTSMPVLPVVERALSSVHIAAKNANVTIRHEIGVGMPHVVIDPDKVQQVLVNLISNAVKFNREGGEVVVSAEPAPIRRPFEDEDFFGAESDDALMVTVRDSGIGIKSEQLERIFEAFYQGDSTSTREHGGAGLGLSIVRKLVEAHGGEVWAESSVGVGTSFYFTVPLASGGASSEDEDDGGEVDLLAIAEAAARAAASGDGDGDS